MTWTPDVITRNLLRLGSGAALIYLIAFQGIGLSDAIGIAGILSAAGASFIPPAEAVE